MATGNVRRSRLMRAARVLSAEVRDAASRKGALLIPAFAVERTQELIVDLVDLMERGEIPAAPIFLDSPLAIRATEVFRKHASSLDPGSTCNRLLNSPQLRFTETVDESKAIAKLTGFHIVIAASGMCDAGRIRHHLRNWLWNARATVLLVGFQAQGTLGRFLADGAKAVRIQGNEIKVAARIRNIDDYSGHADGSELTRWIAARRPIERGLFLVHGEEPAIADLAERISERIIPAARVFQPLLDDIYELSAAAPTLLDGSHRRRLAPEAVVRLDWHNDMSELILDINDRIEAATDDRARGVIIRGLRCALHENGYETLLDAVWSVDPPDRLIAERSDRIDRPRRLAKLMPLPQVPCNLLHTQAHRIALDRREATPHAWPAPELTMMAAFAKAISRATRTNVDVETLKILVIFSGAGLLVSLLAAMLYGQALSAALF